MPRSTSAVARNKRKKKIFKAAKGYFGGRKNLYRTAKDAVEKGWEHAYRDRKKKKRNFRRLWITRINAAVREHDLSYSRFINGLKEAGVREIFTPGASTANIIDWVETRIEPRPR